MGGRWLCQRLRGSIDVSHDAFTAVLQLFNLNRTAVTRVTNFSHDFSHFSLIAARASVAVVN